MNRNKKFAVAYLVVGVALLIVAGVLMASDASAHKVGDRKVTFREYSKIDRSDSMAKVRRVFGARGRVIERSPFATYVGCNDTDGAANVFCNSGDPNTLVMSGPGQTRRFKNSCGRPVIVEFVKQGATWKVAVKDTYFPQGRHCSHGYI